MLSNAVTSPARSGFIPDNAVAEVRERTDIVGIIGNYVALKRSGVNFKGLCPFHEEKTPSFNVNSARQFFHCFGCGESGDVFKFLMKIEGRTFVEVIEDLAGKAGVELPRLSPKESKEVAQRRSERQQAFELNRKVATLYREALLGKAGASARHYLKDRGIDDAVAERFELGYAPAAGDLVVRAMAQAKVPPETAVRLGLIAQRRGRPGHFDRFWNRLIFPLISAQGEVLGFGGRRLGEGDGPKYINTPETALYRKGEALYGLHAAHNAIRKQDTALIVEGNIDVLRLHQVGLTHTVAPMGTALTGGQIRLLGRFAANVVFLFDGDAAGRAAARKAVPLVVEAGLDARFVPLPDGQDPDSYLSAEGPAALEASIVAALPAVDYYVSALREQMKDDSVPAQAKLLEQCAALLKKLPSAVARDLYADRLSLTLHVDRAIVDRAIQGQRVLPQVRGQRGPAADAEAAAGTPPAADGAGQQRAIAAAEVEPLGLLVAHPHLFARAEKQGLTRLLTNHELRATYQTAMAVQRESGTVSPANVLEAAVPSIREALARILLTERFAGVADPTRALDDYLSTLRRRQLEQERQTIRNEMTAAQSAGDGSATRALGLKLIEVERQIHETR